MLAGAERETGLGAALCPPALELGACVISPPASEIGRDAKLRLDANVLVHAASPRDAGIPGTKSIGSSSDRTSGTGLGAGVGERRIGGGVAPRCNESSSDCVSTSGHGDEAQMAPVPAQVRLKALSDGAG